MVVKMKETEALRLPSPPACVNVWLVYKRGVSIMLQATLHMKRDGFHIKG